MSNRRFSRQPPSGSDPSRSLAGRPKLRASSTRQLIAYFALAYALSWGAMLLYLAVIRFDFAALLDQRLLFLGFMLAGPSIAGLALTAVFDGRQGLADLLRRLVRLDVGIRWYAFALLPVPIVLLAVLLPLAIFSSPDYTPTFLAFGIAAGLLAGFFEELGWTGFATPRLLRIYSPFRAGIILGVAWGVWHALGDFSGNITTMSAGAWAVRMIVYWMIPLTCWRVLMTWAYAHHGSLGLGMIMHAGYTGWLVTFTMDMSAAAGPQALVWEGLFAIAIAVVTVVVMSRSRQVVSATSPVPQATH